MNKVIILIAIFYLALIGCTKDFENYQLVKNSYNSYLVGGDEYLLICNPETTQNIESGTWLDVDIKKLKSSCHQEGFYCPMGEPENGFAKIRNISN